MVKNIFYVKDYIEDNSSDSDAIERCLKASSYALGEKTVVFDSRDFYIDRAILVPSNIQIIIDGCLIKQNNGVFDNVFRSANVSVDETNPYGIPLDVKQLEDVRIIGKNGASIAGPDVPKVGYHPVLENHQNMTGDFWGWRTHMFSFPYAKNIEVCGLILLQTMGWAMSFDSGYNINIHDLEIHSDVKNGDGIDFRSGCHDCIVQNIAGYTSDDTIACTAMASSENVLYPVKNYLYPSEPYNELKKPENKDIHDIVIRNIMTGGKCHGVICLAARGNQVYNISIDGVIEHNKGNREASVKIYTGYWDGYKPGDIHDISVKNVQSKISEYAVQVTSDVKNVTLKNIRQERSDGKLTIGI